MQEKLEAKWVGRLLISVFVAVTVGALAVWNMPDSHLRREGMRLAGPYVRAVGLDQYWWTIFAPDPVQSSFVLSARVTYEDGTRGTWEVPVGGDVIGTYWDYRWGKWSEATLTGNPDLCRGTAIFVANRLADEGRTAEQVELVAHRRNNARPGQEPAHAEWEESTVCTVDVGAARGAA